MYMMQQLVYCKQRFDNFLRVFHWYRYEILIDRFVLMLQKPLDT